jgi:hypothetical protein
VKRKSWCVRPVLWHQVLVGFVQCTDEYDCNILSHDKEVAGLRACGIHTLSEES